MKNIESSRIVREETKANFKESNSPLTLLFHRLEYEPNFIIIQWVMNSSNE